MSDRFRSLNSVGDIEFAVKRIEELEAKLAKAVEIGDKMAASIERNYYLPGVATDWRKLTGGKDE